MSTETYLQRQPRSTAQGNLRDHARRVAASVVLAGWSLRHLRGQADTVRRGPRPQAGEAADRVGDRPDRRSTHVSEGAPVQAMQSSAAPSSDGQAGGSGPSHHLSGRPASESALVGYAELIQQPFLLPYKCGACQVQGIGDECWYCGSRSILRQGLSTLNGYHHHDPNRTHTFVGPCRIDFEDVDGIQG